MKKTLLICLLTLGLGCAKRTQKLTPVDAKPTWMATEKLYNDRSFDGEFLTHPFFDLVPFASKEDNSVNFVMTTPAGALNKYDVDLRSGRLYRSHKFCAQEDIWKKYSGTIYRPPYSEGFVPRLLDQLGTPQKIIVFGKGRYFQEYQIAPTRSQRVRVVGGVLLQYCDSYPCRGVNKWQSRLLLVAVNPLDPNYKNINSINQLKKTVDWEEITAFIQNSNGRKLSGSEPLPSYRIVGNIGKKEALRIALAKGHLFSFKEMKTVRKSCHALYDHLWSNVKALTTPKKKSTRSSEEQETPLDNSQKDTFSGNVISAEERDVKKAPVIIRKPEINNFSIFFKDFYARYKDRYKTCQQFVRDTSINEDKERMWFFSFLSSFLNTEETGYIYSCTRKAWVLNPVRNSGQRAYSFKDSINRCTTAQLNAAFNMSINIQAGLGSSHQQHFRYIEYDHGEGASHQKIYSWVKDLGDGYICDQKRRRELPIFPQDINWKNFGDGARGGNSLIVR